MCLFLAGLGLNSCVGFPQVAASRCYFLVVACGLLIAVASLGAEQRLSGLGASVVAAPRLQTQVQSLWHTGLVAP